MKNNKRKSFKATLVVIPVLFIVLSAHAGTELSRCGECHEEVKDYPNLHSPVEADECLECHTEETGNPDLEGHKFSFADQPNGPLCFLCHDEKKEIAENPDVHPAVSEDCRNCHNPHGSKTKALMKKDTLGAVCLECHDDRVANPFLHGGKPENDCTICHQPKGTAAKLFQKEDLCTLTCHSPSLHSLSARHLAATPQKEEKSGVLSLPLRPSGKVYCYTCHQPHLQNTIVAEQEIPVKTKESAKKPISIVAEAVRKKQEMEKMTGGKVVERIRPSGSYRTLRTSGDVDSLCLSCHTGFPGAE